MGLILLIILIILAVGALPHWSYAQSWDYSYYPSGILGLVLLVVLILLIMGIFPLGF
jgi:hypothetical protein